ncbi:glycosyltransferase family 2 protein [Cetobacterium somerae]
MCKGMLSVVVAAYNVEDYIEKCIDSLINQTYKNLEILVVNDGSTDKTLKILEKYKKSNNVIILNKSNGGLSSARNYGIKHSRGEFLTFVDGDDYLEKEAYEVSLNEIKKDNSELCIFGFSKIYDKKEKKIHLNKNLYKERFLEKIFSKSDEASIIVCNKIFKNILIKENKLFFENKAYFEDTGFIFRYLYFVNKISIVDKPFYNYLQRKGSITKKIDYIILDSLKNTNDVIENFYNEKNKIIYYKKYIRDMKLRMQIYTYRHLKKNGVKVQFKFDWKIILNSHIPIKHRIYLVYIKLDNIILKKKNNINL